MDVPVPDVIEEIVEGLKLIPVETIKVNPQDMKL